MNNKKVIFLSVLWIAALLILSGCSGNPEEKILCELDNGNYERVVSIYNSEIKGTGLENKVNKILEERINVLVEQWDCEDIELSKALDALKNLSSLENERLSQLSNDNYKIVNIEGNGKMLLSKAEQCYATDDFGNAMKYCMEIDPAYSLYDNAEELYNTTEKVVLETVSTPYSSEDCKMFSEQLGDYLSVIDNEKFVDRKSELENLTIEYIAAEAIVDNAARLFDEKQYKSCFNELSEGIKKYPANNLLYLAQENTRGLYVIQVTQSALSLCEEKEYKKALNDVEAAIDVYDCDEFAELKDSIKKQKSFIYRITTSVIDKFKAFSQDANGEKLSVKGIGSKTGAYVVKSGKKIALGDYSDEDVTILSFTGDILASIAGVDLIMDLRDVSYDLTHWGEEEYFLVYLAADTIALIPVIGVVKYFDIKAMNKTIDVMKQVSNVSDTVKNAGKVADVAGTIIDANKTYKKIGEAVDDTKEITRFSKAKNKYIRYVTKPTINARYAGKVHPLGVMFEEKRIKYSDGTRIVGVFPKFDSKYEIKLEKKLYKGSREEHFAYCNKRLKEAIENDSNLRKQFTDSQIEEIMTGIKSGAPSGYTWHHNEREGIMELVDAEMHNKVAHTGGFSIWGAGSLQDAA